MKLLCRRLCLPVVTIALAGCQAAAPEPVSRHLVNPVEIGRLGYRHRWTTDLGIQAGSHLDKIAVLDDVIVLIETPGNLVSAWSANDGAHLWFKKVGNPSDRLFEPRRSGDHILINSESKLYSLAASNGKIEQVHSLHAPVHHAPALRGNLVIFGGQNGHLYAQDIESGAFRWAHGVGSAIIASPVLNESYVLATTDRGAYKLVSAASGKAISSGRTFGRISAAPVATEAGFLVASEDHTLYALTNVTLLDRWKYRAPKALTQAPVVLQSVAYLPVTDHGLVALDAISGEKLWELPGVTAQPVDAVQDKVLLNMGTELALLASETGRKVSSLPTHPLLKVVRMPERHLVLVSRAGRMMRLDRG